MAQKITAVSNEELKLARLAKFKKKKPKKGKLTTLSSKENYIDKYNAWAKEVKEYAKEGKKLKSINDELKKA